MKEWKEEKEWKNNKTIKEKNKWDQLELNQIRGEHRENSRKIHGILGEKNKKKKEEKHLENVGESY